MVLPGFVLAALCILIGLLGATVVASMGPLVSEVTAISATVVRTSLAEAAHSVAFVSLTGGALLGVSALLATRAGYRTCGSAGRGRCDVGLWLCRAVAANAVHRIVLRPTVDRHLRLALANTSHSCCAARLVSDRG